MDLTHLVDAARVIEDALRRGRLASVDMRHYSDISCFLKRGLPWHLFSVSFLI
jgi:hypothetical protein